MDGFPPELQDSFRPERLLGAGAMGRVYLARDLSLDRLVAVKLGDVPTPELRQRFLREAATLARIRHPNVVEVFDFGLAGDTPYLVMEYLEGRTLDEEAGPGAPLELMLQVAEALEAVHAAGVVHRDVKPSNLLVTPAGRPVLVDFGLVRDARQAGLTRTGQWIGTPLFMAPEVGSGAPRGPPMDWFAFGVTLFWLVTGRYPFTPEQVVGWLGRGERPDLDLGGVPPHLVPALRACLEEDPIRRPRSRRDLERLLQVDPEPGPPPRPATPAAPAAAEDTQPLARGAFQSSSAASPGRRGLPPWARGAWVAAIGCLVALALRPGPRGVSSGPATPGPPPARPRELEALPGPPVGRAYRNLRDQSLLLLVPEVPVLLGETEVTVARYQRFLDATGGRPPRAWDEQLAVPERPVVLVTRDEAIAYCAWAGGRLPSAAEWAMAGGAAQGRRHPWGEAPPGVHRAVFGHNDPTLVALDTLEFLAPVTGRPAGAGPYGHLDLVGNAAEWTTDLAPGDGGRAALVVGGAWYAPAEEMTLAMRRPWPVSDRAPTVGFRLAREVPPAPPVE